MSKRGRPFPIWALVISISAHCGLFYWLLSDLYQPHKPLKKKAGASLIQASLVLDPIKPALSPDPFSEVPEQQSHKRQSPRQLALENPVIQPAETIETSAAPESSQSLESRKLSKNGIALSHDLTRLDSYSKLTQSQSVIAENTNSQPQLNAKASSSETLQQQEQSVQPVEARSAASYLKVYQQQQLHQLAKQQASRYQQQKRTPAKRKSPLVKRELTENEIFKANVAVKVDCSHSAKQAVSIAAGLFGGTIRCESSPQLDAYLAERRRQLFADEGQIEPLRSVVVE
ncbi:hypothetical protein [Agarivorans sp. DSG3-1]|uniref:hypothetical protein n=1 Tax=Agarivorans sp. DSG3-1 TaxID=3342249 RepID=UPI00398F8837